MKVEVIWFDTVVSEQSLKFSITIFILPINYVSDQNFGVRLKFETLVSAKYNVTECIMLTRLM